MADDSDYEFLKFLVTRRFEGLNSSTVEEGFDLTEKILSSIKDSCWKGDLYTKLCDRILEMMVKQRLDDRLDALVNTISPDEHCQTIRRLDRTWRLLSESEELLDIARGNKN